MLSVLGGQGCIADLPVHPTKVLAARHLLFIHHLFTVPMSTTTIVTPSEIWNNILKGNVEKDDPLWKEYLDKAAVFDTRMVDEWNKIVDVLLVYVGYFSCCLHDKLATYYHQIEHRLRFSSPS